MRCDPACLGLLARLFLANFVQSIGAGIGLRMDIALIVSFAVRIWRSHRGVRASSAHCAAFNGQTFFGTS
jgi:hypothetical protein